MSGNLATSGRYPGSDSVTDLGGRARVQWHELVAALDGVELTGDPTADVTGVAHDSRDVVPGDCFACIPGARFDGHDFAADATAAGAVALLVERRLPLAVAQARVASVRAALGPVAAACYGHPSHALCCVGVTGTNGKTTTTYLLEAITRAAGESAGVIGTVGARLDGEPLQLRRTTPEADELQALLARMRDAGVVAVAMEVSSHALDQHRVDGTWFSAVCFTNLSHEHLDYHGTIEQYFEAKASLFDPARAAAAAVNVGDPYGEVLAARVAASGLTCWTFASAHGAVISAREIERDATGVRFRLVEGDDGARADATVRLPFIGTFNVENALAAAATARAAGFGFDHVVAGLSQPVVVPGRVERVDAGQPFAVYVDYAHTPDALARVLDAAREHTSRDVIAVFGCGGDRDRAKRPLMGRIAAERADVAVLTSDNPRSEDPEAIAADVLPGLRDGHAKVLVELDRRAAIATALRAAAEGSVVVVAGKGHETGQTWGDVTIPFDDRTVVREELGALGWN